jgi:hypothetical protein
MDYRAMFKGEYLTAPEFGGRTPTFTITQVKMVRLLAGDDGSEKDKGVLLFKETERGVVLNKTNAQSIAAMFGNETDGWIGKRVTFHATEVQVGPKKDLGIRVLGSPDITKPITATITLPRKKPKPVVLQVTGEKKPAAREPGCDDA